MKKFITNEEVHVLITHDEDDDELTTRVFSTFDAMKQWIKLGLQEVEDPDYKKDTELVITDLKQKGYGAAFGTIYLYECTKTLSLKEL
jgi:hypothetical protein